MTQYEVYKISSTCISVKFGDGISNTTSDAVLAAYEATKAYGIGTGKLTHVVDVVPAYSELAFHFSRPITDIVAKFEEVLGEVFATKASTKWWKKIFTKNSITIPVKYDGEDLTRIAAMHDMSVEDVIKIHTGASYKVAMVGFKPHFPYLIGLDPRLETPRLDSPRTKVPEGSVAIGGSQTGIYPESSPGGWNIIGSTDPKLLTKIKAGNVVKFKAVK